MKEITAFFFGLLGSLVAVVVCKIVMGAWYKVAKDRFSINGIWIATFNPPGHHDSGSIEIMAIRQWRDDIRIRFENYNTSRTKIIRFRGRGKFRSSQLSVYYYSISRSHPAIGAFVLRLRDSEEGVPCLHGVYTQTRDRAKYRGVKIFTESYELRRISAPWAMRVRAVLHCPMFPDFASAEYWIAKYTDSLCKQNNTA